LLILAAFDVAIAVSVFTVPSQSASSYAGQAIILPLRAWGYVWCVMAGLMVFQAFSKRDRMAFVLMSAMKLAWACGFLISFFYYDAPRAWLQAATYATFAALVLVIVGWPEKQDPPAIVMQA
jgi:hypothetical protein